MRFCLTCLVLAFLGLGFAPPASGQVTPPPSYSIVFDDEDPSYTQTPGFHYQLVPLTVTDTLTFSFDALSLTQVGTGDVQTNTILLYAFPVGVPLPTAPANQLEHLIHPDLAFYLTDGEPNLEGPVSPQGGTLVAGQYQVILASFDHTGAAGDQLLVFALEGGVLLWIPLTETELARISLAGSTAGRLAVGDAVGLAARQAQASFAARTRDARRVPGRDPDRQPEEGAVQSSRGASGLVGNLFTWAEIGGFRAENPTRRTDLTGASLQFGADLEVAPGLLVGMSFGLNRISASGAGFSQTGHLRFFQPYVAYRSGHFGLEGSAFLGWGDLTQESIGGIGTADTSFFAVNATARYEYQGWGDTLIVPVLSLTHGAQDITGTGGTLAGAARETVSFTEVSLGTEIAFVGAAWGEARLGLHADWLSEDAVSPTSDALLGGEGWSGRVSLGLTGLQDTGAGFDAALEIGGIGADHSTLSGGLRVNFRF